MVLFRSVVAALACSAATEAICDGNPHEWGRVRRCDQQMDDCPTAEWASGCVVCEGVGGIPFDDTPTGFSPASCVALPSPAQTPANPLFPKVFTNDRFFEAQIFVKQVLLRLVHYVPLCDPAIVRSVLTTLRCPKHKGTIRFVWHRSRQCSPTVRTASSSSRARSTSTRSARCFALTTSRLRPCTRA